MMRRRLPSMLLACLSLALPARAAVLTVGAGGTYTTLADAVAAALAGDTIAVQAGTYVDQVATINVPLTITGVGGPVILTQAAAELPGLKGYLVVNADTTVQNITFSGASISDGNGGNGAGIRYQAGNLTVINSQFTGNQDGILATPNVAGTGNVLIQNSTFTGNGEASGTRSGFDHALYATNIASLTVTGSTFQGTLVGHDIKSRAAVTVVTNNYLDDGVTGTTSYAIDAPDGGAVTITGNTINQGPNTQNRTMVTYAEEDTSGAVWINNSLSVSGNLFENTNPFGAIGVANAFAFVNANISCNAFIGVPTLLQGAGTLAGNVTSGGIPSCGLPVPEPSMTLSWAFGLLPLGLWRWKQSRRQD